MGGDLTSVATSVSKDSSEGLLGWELVGVLALIFLTPVSTLVNIAKRVRNTGLWGTYKV